MTIRERELPFSPALGVILLAFGAPVAFSMWIALGGESSGQFTQMLQTVLPGYLFTTFMTLTLSMLVAVGLALIPAYLVTFYRLPFGGVIDTALVLPLAVPSYLVAVTYRETLAVTDLPMQSTPGLAWVMAITTYPYLYVLLRVSFQRQSTAFLETAAALGVRRSDALRRVILPLAIPALALGCVLVAVESTSDFGAADVLSVSTLTMAVRRILFSSFDEHLALQVALLSAIVPLVLALLYWQLTRTRRFASPVNRPRSVVRATLSPARTRLAAAVCLLPPVLGFFGPAAVLAVWSTKAFQTFDLVDLTISTINTVMLSVLVALCVAALGLAVSLMTRRRNRNQWRIASIGMLSINLALPSIVLGVTLLALTGWDREWSYMTSISDTIVVLLVAMVLKFSAFGYFSVESTFSTLPEKLEEAGLASRRSAWHVLRRVLLPISGDGVIIGATLAFLISAKELTLSLTLHPFGFKSLSMSTYHLAKVDAHPEAAIPALCLILICLYPVLSLHRWIMR